MRLVPRLRLTIPRWRTASVRPRLAFYLVLWVVVGLLVWEIVPVVIGNNFHAIVDGFAYRSAQLNPESMRQAIQKYGIRTMINLRGTCNPFDWYLDECRVTHDCNISQEDITLSANRLPPPQELKRLVDVLDHCEFPIMMHCRRGSDRTGLAATVVCLLYTKADLQTAKQQLSIRYGHFNWLTTANMDRFVNLYETWLAEQNKTHTPEFFRYWLMNEYVPGPCLAHLEMLEMPTSFPAKKPIRLTLRSHNRSKEPWIMKPGTYAGIHLRYILTDATGKHLYSDRAGQFHKRIEAGSHVDLLIGLPALHRPGKYYLHCDMIATQQVAFVQEGSEPLIVELDIRE